MRMLNSKLEKVFMESVGLVGIPEGRGGLWLEVSVANEPDDLTREPIGVGLYLYWTEDGIATAEGYPEIEPDEPEQGIRQVVMTPAAARLLARYLMLAADEAE